MTHSGGMLDVELVAAEDDPGPTTAAPRRFRRRWFVVGAVAVAAALGVTQWAGVTGERAEQARLAAVPGVLAPVDDTLVVSRPAPDVGLGAAAVHVDGRGAQSLSWAGWTTTLAGPNAALADAEGQVVAASTCRPDSRAGADPSTADHVVCLVTDGGVIRDGGSSFAQVPATSRQVVVLSADDGAVLAQWSVDHGDSMALFPGGVALGSAYGTGTTVTAYVSLTGEERWTYVDPDPAAIHLSSVSLFRAGDLLAYRSSPGSLLLLSTDGTAVRTITQPTGGSWGWGTDPRTGQLVLESQDATGAARMTIVAPDGDPDADVTVAGGPVHLTVDDGSVPGLLLSADSAVHAWDAGSGAARWSHADDTVASALVLRGRVYLATGGRIVALDGRTGRVLWTARAEEGLVPRALLTDGDHLLVGLIATSTDATPALVAYDPATGQEDFRASYPPGVTEVTSIGRQLIGHDGSSDEYVVLE
ncbi:PQQ-binding-like beta-propeller repeat protein [Cellulomonas sp. ICMP 17802]|uniref:outer membrane protein assembly factor BamB family protein n=1 Tax=Cellulomonas sp. ICMP 17802 TaxID=3239199 RepID=UPI00351AB241